MKKLLLCAFAMLVFVGVQAQQRVVLESNGTTTTFGGDQPFVDAYEAAVDGDVIYLPGTALAVPSAIDKSLTIYGAGHYPAGTTATGKTSFNANLTITENADGLHLEGIDMGDFSIHFEDNNKVDDVVIARCYFFQINYQGTATTVCLNNLIRECVINSNVYLNNATSTILSNNIIAGRVYNGTNNAIQNNILLYDYRNSAAGYSPIINVDNSTVSNNIFLKTYNATIQFNCQSTKFINNIFAHTPSSIENEFTDNYNNVSVTGLFANQAGNTFNYLHDYHLASPATYTNGDGVEAGIYGGLFPYKANAVPAIPHISAKTIAGSTDENGLLNISITVSAQED